MELTQKNIPSAVKYHGDGRFTMLAEQSLKIETTPDGAEILNDAVPEGKKWTVSVRVDVIETDA